jgi:chloramphenicol O-acetyltransferase type B
MLPKFLKLALPKYYRYRVTKRCAEYGAGLKVNGRSNVNRNTKLGNNVNFNGMRIKGRGIVTIGDNFHSGEGILFLTENHKYEHAESIPYDDTNVSQPIIIGDNVWLGDRVIVLSGCEIGEGAIIQAGSVVVSNIPACAIAGGHPARVFKYRDKDHYYKLKAEGRFL